MCRQAGRIRQFGAPAQDRRPGAETLSVGSRRKDVEVCLVSKIHLCQPLPSSAYSQTWAAPRTTAARFRCRPPMKPLNTSRSAPWPSISSVNTTGLVHSSSVRSRWYTTYLPNATISYPSSSASSLWSRSISATTTGTSRPVPGAASSKMLPANLATTSAVGTPAGGYMAGDMGSGPNAAKYTCVIASMSAATACRTRS
ncbi:hypothetical protein CMQ_7292 [Grosmannia clavigera kw1407]|uniref:Uncharacterized protein n=1 Tax=Grosmannia clavigera (strain kw1407 / UAMH 11150) TaxID=655863 RepID=F0XPK1_GROCL|nr:uncharacterized protein CMQ_7292 [Grosmannia clavigera kw1407]EFX00290.1 hypothetical protein CMQ_7292 [Grosmannia clavigera kw1407]